VFPVDFGGSEHVYRAHPINIQLVTDPVLMLAKEEHGRMRFWFINMTNMGHVTFCIAMLKDVIKVSLLQKTKNDRIKNIVSVFYGIQYSLKNFELSATILTISSSDHNISASKTARHIHTGS
jgi:hypothetical protein